MHTVAYGTGPDQVFDLHPAHSGEAGPSRTIVYIHGGFWRPEIDRSHARPLVQELAAAGDTVVNLEYSRPASGRWTAISRDLVLALAAVAERADVSDRIVVMGHSAGGQMAAWLAAQDLPIAGAVTLAGCLDLDLAGALDLGQGALTSLMVGEGPEAVATADPRRQAPRVPVLALHGTGDATVPIELSRSYAAAHPGRVELVELPGVDHFAIIEPRGHAFAAITDALERLAPA